MDSCSEQVQIWIIALRPPGAGARAQAALLDSRERARSARIVHPRARERYVSAHAGVRLVLSRHLGVPPASLAWRVGTHGKPRLAGPPGTPHTSLSHSGELALLAVARREVGVDVERVAARWSSAPPVRFFPPSEAAAVARETPAARAALFVRLFARKEACVKAAGTTLLPHGIRLRTAGTAPLTVAGEGPERWRVRDVQAADGYGGAVALRGPGDFGVVLRPWSFPDSEHF